MCDWTERFGLRWERSSAGLLWTSVRQSLLVTFPLGMCVGLVRVVLCGQLFQKRENALGNISSS